MRSADGSRGRAQTQTGLLAEAANRFTREYILVTFPLGVLITIYYSLWGPHVRTTSLGLVIAGNLFLFVVYGAIFIVLLHFWLRGVLHRTLAWIDEPNGPTPTSPQAAVELPRRIAWFVFSFQAALALLTALINLGRNHIFAEAARVAVYLWLSGLTFAAIAYLVAEHSLRDVFPRVFADAPRSAGTAVGVRSRLLFAWGVGSAIPLLFILAIPLARSGHHQVALRPVWPMLFMAGTGLIVGAVTTTAVARSISEPLAAVRSALGRVREGDLDEELPVADPGEVGLLQAGFNEMVAGLRERRLLEDLFGRHVGEEVARRAVDQGVELGGELREASVLMVDLVGSTPLARRLPPQEVVELLNAFFSVVIESVSAEGGWVNKFEGDAALCVFGVPDHLADHASRALRSAQRMRQGLGELFAEHATLDAGVGVSAGVVVAGNVGAARRLEYTVIGDPVNEAARLAELAKQVPERTVASGSIVDLAAAATTAWRERRSVLLRGRDVETRIFVPVDGPTTS